MIDFALKSSEILGRNTHFKKVHHDLYEICSDSEYWAQQPQGSYRGGSRSTQIGGWIYFPWTRCVSMSKTWSGQNKNCCSLTLTAVKKTKNKTLSGKNRHVSFLRSAKCASSRLPTKAGASTQPVILIPVIKAHTYRYFLETPVCLCRATENPKKLPLVFPSLITGKRSSMLNPAHGCVPWKTTRSAKNKSRGDMFAQIHVQCWTWPTLSSNR